MRKTRSSAVPLGLGAGVLLVASPVAGHFLWPEIGWFFSLLFALMVLLMVLTVLLIASTMHDPVRRWDLPPSPATQQRGWRAALARVRDGLAGFLAGLRGRLPRRKSAAS